MHLLQGTKVPLLHFPALTLTKRWCEPLGQIPFLSLLFTHFFSCSMYFEEP